VRGPALAGQHVVQPGGDVGVVVEAQHLRFGKLVGELGAVTLREAADGGHLGARVRGGEQLVDRLLLGRLDEAARVDEDDRSVFALARHRPAAGRQACGQLF
jgi:hypothetical protein